MAQLAGQLKELSGRLPALSSRLDLQEQTLGLRLSEVRQAAEGRQGYGESPPRRLSAHHCPQGRGWTGQSQASHHPATVPRAQETPSSRDSCVGWDGRWAASAHGAAMQAVTERQTSSLHPSCSCSLCTSSIETDSLPTRFTREQVQFREFRVSIHSFRAFLRQKEPQPRPSAVIPIPTSPGDRRVPACLGGACSGRFQETAPHPAQPLRR